MKPKYQKLVELSNEAIRLAGMIPTLFDLDNISEPILVPLPTFNKIALKCVHLFFGDPTPSFLLHFHVRRFW